MLYEILSIKHVSNYFYYKILQLISKWQDSETLQFVTISNCDTASHDTATPDSANVSISEVCAMILLILSLLYVAGTCFTLDAVALADELIDVFTSVKAY
ncbi:hypothetical protein RIR_jg30541.t1 [Rhizophagus irregularis DAOM 181602=DAOM 197198]|nr:hypothetical protein RIR_jg30541.t1 [Rhizophagus irregularis DAOM 181602=DAOM 197198]